MPSRNHLATGRVLVSPAEDTSHFSAEFPQEACHRAIAVARAAGLPLKIAATVDRLDRDYYDATIKPLLHEPGIEYIGEIDERAKERFLGDALALIFPIDWPEPFGLVTIEAMACGTPVLAFDKGAMREVIDEGVTGFVVQSVAEATTVLDRVLALDRARVRHRFEERFTARRMAIDYVRIYQQLLDCTGLQTAA